MTSSRRPQRNTTDGETDGRLNKDGARKQNHDNGGVSETGDRQQSTQPQGNSAGGVSQDTHCGGAYPGEKTTTRPPRHRRNRRGRKGAEQRQPEGIEQGQPGEEPHWPRRGAKPRSPWRNYRPTVERRQELTTSRKEKPRGHGDRPKGRAERRPEAEKDEGAESSAPKNGPKRRRRERERVGP